MKVRNVKYLFCIHVYTPNVHSVNREDSIRIAKRVDLKILSMLLIQQIQARNDKLWIKYL